MRWLAVVAATAVVLVACSSPPSAKDEAAQFVQRTDVMREITAADCKRLRELEDRYLLKSNTVTAEQATDAATYLPVIRSRLEELRCQAAATRQDPGVAACKTVAKRAKAGVTPTDTQRAAVWKQLQRSGHKDLQAVGAKLQRAWTTGGLADQVEANTNAAMACAVHGVEVKLGG